MKFIKIDKNGTKYFEKRVTCWRCGNIAGGLYIVGTNNGQMVPSGISANEGDAVKVRGTVKQHSEYINKRERVEDENGVELPLITTKQTVLTRCKVQEIN